MASIYTQLLAAADARACQLAGEPTNGERLVELLRCRVQLGARRPSPSTRGWAPGAIGDQVAYDLALIGLARQLGVACNAFDPPEPERRRLEAELSARGVSLDDLGERASLASAEDRG